jgi:hypothetical protein
MTLKLFIIYPLGWPGDSINVWYHTNCPIFGDFSFSGAGFNHSPCQVHETIEAAAALVYNPSMIFFITAYMRSRPLAQTVPIYLL